MMTFSVSTVDCSEFIFFRGKQITLHSLAIDSTFDARVQNKRNLQELTIDLAPNVWLHSSVGRASHRYRGGHGFESR